MRFNFLVSLEGMLKRMKFNCYLIVLMLASFGIQAQSTKIDSLHRLLVKADDLQKIHIFIELAIEQAGTSNETAINTVKNALALARQVNDCAGISRSGKILGMLYNRLEQYTEAILILNEVLIIAGEEHYNEDLKYILNALGSAYAVQANYDKALACHLRSFTIREAQGNKKEMSISLLNIGFAYYKLRNYDKALEYYTRALDLKLAEKDDYDLDRLYINIALCFDVFGKFDEAKRYLKEGLLKCGSNCSEQIKTEAEYAMGRILFKENDVMGAYVHIKESLKYARKVSDRFQAESLTFLAEILIREKEYGEASRLLKEAEQICLQFKFDAVLLDVYQNYATLYKERGDFENLSFVQTRYIDLKEEIYNVDMRQNISRLQSGLEQRDNIQTIESQKIRLSLDKNALAEQKNLNNLIVLAVLLFVVVIVILYKSNQQRKKMNRFLEVQVKERTQQLEASYDAARQSNDDMQAVINYTSRDIRSCIASIKGICNLVRQDHGDESVAGLHQSVVQLTSIVEGIQRSSDIVPASIDNNRSKG
jgi:tetratricopeptide (TPR) repeat protein